MRELNVADIQKLDKGEVIPSIHGTVKNVYQRRTGVNERGDWSVQDAVLTLEDGEVKVKFWGHDDLQALTGKEVTVRAYESKTGLTSLFADDDTYKGSTTRYVRATGACKIVVGLGNGQKTNDDSEDFIPMTHDAKGAALPGVDEAKQHLMRCVNFYNLCVDAVDTVVKPNVNNMTAEMYQAAVSSVFIEGSRSGMIAKMPTTKLK